MFDELTTLEIPITGMDCADCTRHVQRALAGLPGVGSAEVFLMSEKAIVALDPTRVNLPTLRQAVAAAGYAIPPDFSLPSTQAAPNPQLATPNSPLLTPNSPYRSVLALFGLVFGFILFVVVVGEWLGLFEALTARVPWPVGLALVLVAGYPVFRNVLRAALQRQVISHTLMTLGVLAALAVGQWATAVVVVFFMRIGDYAEHFTAERARRAVRDLTALAPQTARLERAAGEEVVPVGAVRPGDVVIVRPGEMIPVDGEVIGGHATVDQAAITGESLPVEAGPGAQVYAATFASLGSLRLRAARVGQDSTFGRVIRLVEEAEAHRAAVQRLADRFSAWYLPVVAAIAGLTLLLRRDPLAAAAVLVVACSCSIALATPIAMLASIGAGARRGLLIKGGKYLETLAKADVLLIDKTGTLTLGRPEITDILPAPTLFPSQSTDLPVYHSTNLLAIHPSADSLLFYAASAERYSEHPLAEAVRAAARARRLDLAEPADFTATPGLGVQARVDGRWIAVGSRRLLGESADLPGAAELGAQGKTLLYITSDGLPVGLLAAADTLRPEVPQAIAELRSLGLRHIELLTGDNTPTAAALAARLDLPFRAELLPEDKIAIVKDYQARGHTVVMVGDGVNDAPALAQADVGIAMGAAGSGVAISAAHIALLRDDWRLVPEVLRIARRTMRVVKSNLAFTAVYNLLGLSLAALGLLPPVFAAAAQSLPDLGILLNSSRLLRQK